MALLRRASNHFYPPEKHSCPVRQISKDKFLIALYPKIFLTVQMCSRSQRGRNIRDF